jgi:chromosome segregation ATPase
MAMPPEELTPPPVPAAQPPPKKRRWFGLKSLLLAMLLCMSGAALAIYVSVPNKSSVTGRLRFANFGALPDKERIKLAQDQETLLADAGGLLRQDARSKLVTLSRNTAVVPGFLSEPIGYSRAISNARVDPKSGEILIPYVGGASSVDQLRMLALMQALYDANGKLVTDAAELNRTVDSLTRERGEGEKKVSELKKQIDELGAVAQSAPDPAERTKLESEAAQLESTYNMAVSAVARLSDELKQLRANPAGPGALNVPPPPASNDEILQKLQGQLKQLDERVGAVQEGRSDKAKAARQRLDAALAAFNKQIEQAQGAVKNNPDLLAYLSSAQKLLGSTRELTDQLMKRQQEQYADLSKVKTNLNDKMLARRAEVWQKDPELLKLMDLKDIKSRQYNAASGQNLTQEAADLKAELDLLDSEIKARQTKVADDGFYADAIDQLQRIIDTTQKGIEDDRKRTMTVLDEMQATLTRSQPALENLTPDQKQLAAEMGKRLEDVSVARREYTAAAAEANKQADEEIGKLQADASTLASRVQARKRELADATTAAEKVAPTGVPAVPPPAPVTRTQAIDQKTAELAAAEKTRTEAQTAWAAANRKLGDLKTRLDAARKAGEDRDKYIRQYDIERKNLDQLLNQYDLKKQLAAAKAYPIKPQEQDLIVEKKDDQRPVYTCAALGSIAAFFVCVILLTGAGRGESLPEYDEQMAGSYESANGNSYYDAFAPQTPHEQAEPVEV